MPTKYTKDDFPYTWHICVYCKQPIIKPGEHSASVIPSYLSTYEGKPCVVTTYTPEEQEKYKDSPKVFYHADCYSEMHERDFLPALLRYAPDREQCETDEEFDDWQESYKKNQEKYKAYEQKKDKPTPHDRLMIRWLKFVDQGKIAPRFINGELHHILSVIEIDTYYSVLDMLIKNSGKDLSRQDVEEKITAKEPVCPTCGGGRGWNRQHMKDHQFDCTRWVQLCQILGFQPFFLSKGNHEDFYPLENIMYSKKPEKEKMQAATSYIDIACKVRYWNLLLEDGNQDKSVKEIVSNHPLKEMQKQAIEENRIDIPEALRNKLLNNLK